MQLELFYYIRSIQIINFNFDVVTFLIKLVMIVGTADTTRKASDL